MSLKKLLRRTSSSSSVTEYSSHQAMVLSPPPGHVTHRHDPYTHVWKPQSSIGDQAQESRIPFYNSGFAACLKCGQRDVWRFEEKAGVRPNGDTYGTESFRCQNKTCRWKTSFKYDDGVPSGVHFEARAWPRGIHHYPVHFMLLWCERHDLPDLKEEILQRQIDGDAFLTLYHSGLMAQALGLGGKTMGKIKKALEMKDGAQLTRSKLMLKRQKSK